MIYSWLSEFESRDHAKASCRLAEALAACGVDGVMVTPDGSVPGWLRSTVPIAAQGHVLGRISVGDTVIFTAARDFVRAARLPARAVLHAQDAGEATGPVIDDASVTVLTGWPAVAADVRRRSGREPIDVGIAVQNAFFHAGARKVAGSVACMPRHRDAAVAACAAARQRLTVVPLDGRDDRDDAVVLHASEFYVALDGDPGCSLAILEALAAGCVVIAVPPAAAALHDGVDWLVAAEHDLGAALRELATPAARVRRAALRDRGRARAAACRPDAQRRRVARLLAGPLAFLRP